MIKGLKSPDQLVDFKLTADNLLNLQPQLLVLRITTRTLQFFAIDCSGGRITEILANNQWRVRAVESFNNFLVLQSNAEFHKLLFKQGLVHNGIPCLLLKPEFGFRGKFGTRITSPVILGILFVYLIVLSKWNSLSVDFTRLICLAGKP